MSRSPGGPADTEKKANADPVAVGRGLSGRLGWLIRGGWIDPQVVAARYDFRGAPAWILRLRPLYVLLGLVGCVGVGGSMTMAELGWVGAFGAMVLGLPAHGRIVAGVMGQPVMIGVLAWGVWVGVNIPRSPNLGHAVQEVGSMRFALLVPVLAPLLPERRRLIAALALGLLAGNVAQGVVAVTRELDAAGAWAWRFSPRNAGWWGHPAIAGYMLLAGLGLHLPAAWMGRGRERVCGVVGALATWGGLIATGTRGAWLAGIALTGLVGAIAAWRVARRGGLRRAMVVTVAGVAAAGVISAAAWPLVASRVREVREEIRLAVAEGDLSTYSGSRVQFARWALEMWRARPIVGHGPGSYEAWVREHVEAGGRATNVHHIAPQAHNLVLHAGATLGLVGVGIMAWIAWFALRGAFAGLPRDEQGRTELGTYDAGPGFAMVGMLLCAPFEVMYVHSPPSAVLGALVALSVLGRPGGTAPGVPTLGSWRRSGSW